MSGRRLDSLLRGDWAPVVCVGVMLLAFAGIALLPSLFPARSGPHPDMPALQMLKVLRAGEELHKTRMAAPRSYCDLDTLRREGIITFGNGGTDAASRYQFRIVVGKDSYTITAIPPKTDMTTYTMNEEGDITP